MKKRSLGPSFIDQIIKMAAKNRPVDKKFVEGWQDILLPNYHPNTRLGLQASFWRITFFIAATLLLFFILSLRLFHLQIIQGYQNRELADGNRIQIKTIHSSRGVIFDRNGKILASNAPGFRLIDPKTKKVVFLTHGEALQMEVENDPRLAFLEVDSIRKYPQAEKLAHVIGYIGEISHSQLKEQKYRSLRLGDRIGQSGVEFYYEDLLRGVNGGEIIEVDSHGRKLRTLRTLAPTPGQNLYLTIDSDLQEQIYKLLSEGVKKSASCCAAAIIVEPRSGQVLSLISLPSFDNNAFADVSLADEIGKTFADPNAPILNRVIGGTYPPGSTYKIVTSLAALDSGKITAKTTIEDTGQIFLGSFRFANWYFSQYGKTEGLVNLTKALKRSNDTFFYRVGQVVGEEILARWSYKLRLGSKLGIDIPGEMTGLVPDNDWKLKNIGDVWYPGDTLHMSIGQGFILTTPLQVLGLTSFLAADGSLYQPQLFLKAMVGQSVAQGFTPHLLTADIISKEHIESVKQGLAEVTRDGGTAWPFFTFPISSAGKTGTAEFGDPKGKTHAWYTGFAPAQNPQIAVTVLIEGGGEGSSVAAPVAKEIYRWYFSEDKNKLIQDVYIPATESAKTLGE